VSMSLSTSASPRANDPKTLTDNGTTGGSAAAAPSSPSAHARPFEGLLFGATKTCQRRTAVIPGFPRGALAEHRATSPPEITEP
jgi:hypothetical protein